MVMLNLGCGNNPLPKPWKNIDKYYYPWSEERPKTAELHPDAGVPEDYDWEYGDFTDLSMYEDNSVDKVNICHALEHVCWNDALHTIAEIYRILKPGGDVEIEVPNMVNVFQGYFQEWEVVVDLIWGGRDKNTYWGGHFCGFTPRILWDKMLEIGFTDISNEAVGFGTSKPEPDRNFRLRGIKDVSSD